jgi:hypothetical protein
MSLARKRFYQRRSHQSGRPSHQNIHHVLSEMILRCT